jgi:hypothetical protein
VASTTVLEVFDVGSRWGYPIATDGEFLDTAMSTTQGAALALSNDGSRGAGDLATHAAEIWTLVASET